MAKAKVKAVLNKYMEASARSDALALEEIAKHKATIADVNAKIATLVALLALDYEKPIYDGHLSNEVIKAFSAKYPQFDVSAKFRNGETQVMVTPTFKPFGLVDSESGGGSPGWVGHWRQDAARASEHLAKVDSYYPPHAALRAFLCGLKEGFDLAQRQCVPHGFPFFYR